ncbi:MAG: restriction endonuclease subunit M, partial [Bacteroidota bacterium]|nr:restriction endonuclease subunit M [Bacteroidota bacterium]
YKFTITENTPIEEDVALDPELLGKVFENLLASYNPETKTTARKQTGSFYTPREIVNYMVDESLIAYLKNELKEWNFPEKELDENLHKLTSYDPGNPFADKPEIAPVIIGALNQSKILDPACGSGAFPMGILQKMVHLLQKLDIDNKIWKQVQRNKVQHETSEVFNIDDKQEREDKLKEINNAFDEKINHPDFARKLYLIENTIYGVDIQPIAVQISKLRFFISLVVDQKNNTDADNNFGILPLPNLETKFVAANTLIGIDKPDAQLSLFDTKEVEALEKELKAVRHKLFSAKTPETKQKYRKKDEELRNAIAEKLKNLGWQHNSADRLARWNPYDQNASSPFFDQEWMFDISKGFDIVIGNPPYVNIYKIEKSTKDI